MLVLASTQIRNKGVCWKWDWGQAAKLALISLGEGRDNSHQAVASKNTFNKILLTLSVSFYKSPCDRGVCVCMCAPFLRSSHLISTSTSASRALCVGGVEIGQEQRHTDGVGPQRPREQRQEKREASVLVFVFAAERGFSSCVQKCPTPVTPSQTPKEVRQTQLAPSPLHVTHWPRWRQEDHSALWKDIC